MHITYITNEFVTEKQYGGLATYLSNIAIIMSSRGHKVTVITLSEQTGRLCYDNNIEVVRVQVDITQRGMSPVEYGWYQISNSWKLYQTLKAENRKRKIDIVQSTSLAAVGFFRAWKIPTVVRASSDSSLLRNAAKFEFSFNTALREKKLEDYLELWCVKSADASFAPSRLCASVIQQRSGKKVEVIESPYLNEIHKMDDSIYQEKLYQKKYLLFNSSLSRLKGTHVGIEATESLLKKYPDLYMVYAGYDYGLVQKNGDIKQVSGILAWQEKKYQGRVIYLKRISQERLFPIIQKSLACVLPSRVDNLPNSCIEAMALGSIVIGTYGASFEQLIKNKENGLLIKKDSSVALVKAVEWLMGMKEEERTEMRRKAVDTVSRLHPDRVYSEMLAFYEKIIERKHRLLS